MKSTREQISPSMLMFSIICFIQASTSLSSFVFSVLKQETWICVILGYLLSLPVIWVYVKLAELYPQKSLIEINDLALGKVVGKLFSVLYLWFFFSLVFLNTITIGSFVVGYIMPETPLMAVIILFILTCAYSVRKGVESMTRYSALFVIMVLLFIAANVSMLIKEMDFSSFFPIFSFPVTNYIQASHTMAAVPFCDIIVFMMLFPHVEKGRSLRKPVFLGLTFGAITLLVTIVRDTAVLGVLGAYLTLPTLEVLRLINIGNTLTKVEVFFIILLIILQFFKTSVALFATVKSASQIFGLRSYKALAVVMGALAAGFAAMAFPSSAEMAYWGRNIAAHYSTFFEAVLPVITLIVALIRKSYKGQKEVGAS